MPPSRLLQAGYRRPDETVSLPCSLTTVTSSGLALSKASRNRTSEAVPWDTALAPTRHFPHHSEKSPGRTRQPVCGVNALPNTESGDTGAKPSSCRRPFTSAPSEFCVCSLWSPCAPLPAWPRAGTGPVPITDHRPAGTGCGPTDNGHGCGAGSSLSIPSKLGSQSYCLQFPFNKQHNHLPASLPT